MAREEALAATAAAVAASAPPPERDADAHAAAPPRPPPAAAAAALFRPTPTQGWSQLTSAGTLGELRRVVQCQSVARRFLARRHLDRLRASRDVFLRMRPPPAEAHEAALAAAAGNAERRRALRARHAADLAAAVAPAAAELAATEGEALKATYTAAFLSWVEASKTPEGMYPDLPTDDEALIAILNPPPPVAPAGKGGKPAAAAAPKPAAAGGKAPPPAFGPHPSEALPLLAAARATFASTWAGKEEWDNPERGHSATVLADELRPQIVASARAAAASAVAELLVGMREAAAAERAARPKTAAPKDAKKGGKDGKDAAAAKKPPAAAPSPPAAARPVARTSVGGNKGRKDATAGVPIEELVSELASLGVLRLPRPPAAPLTLPRPLAANPPADAGDAPPAAPGAAAKPKPGAKGGAVAAPPPVACMADAADAVVERVAAQLGCAAPRSAPALPPRALLLSGAPGAGKRSLVEAAAHAAGAVVLDLSPLRTDALPAAAGKAGGTLLVHKAFKVARTLAPAVVLVAQAERLLSSDKRFAAGGAEPYGRLKRDIFSEVAALTPLFDRVMLVCVTSEATALLTGKDGPSLPPLFDAAIHVPLPTRGERVALWAAMSGQPAWAHGLARASEGRSPGDCAAALAAACAGDKGPRRPKEEFVVAALAALPPLPQGWAAADAATEKAVADFRKAMITVRAEAAAAAAAAAKAKK